jgi:putative membrane protein
VLGLVNAIVRPLLIVLTLPFTLLTLGLFIFIVNAICLGIVAWLVPGFSITGFWAALFGALVISIVSWLLNRILFEKDARKD